MWNPAREWHSVMVLSQSQILDVSIPGTQTILGRLQSRFASGLLHTPVGKQGSISGQDGGPEHPGQWQDCGSKSVLALRKIATGSSQ